MIQIAFYGNQVRGHRFTFHRAYSPLIATISASYDTYPRVIVYICLSRQTNCLPWHKLAFCTHIRLLWQTHSPPSQQLPAKAPPYPPQRTYPPLTTHICLIRHISPPTAYNCLLWHILAFHDTYLSSMAHLGPKMAQNI